MPFKSAAQRRFFHSAGAAKAGITRAQVAEFDHASKGMKLPERVDEKEVVDSAKEEASEPKEARKPKRRFFPTHEQKMRLKMK